MKTIFIFSLLLIACVYCDEEVLSNAEVVTNEEVSTNDDFLSASEIEELKEAYGPPGLESRGFVSKKNDF